MPTKKNKVVQIKKNITLQTPKQETFKKLGLMPQVVNLKEGMHYNLDRFNDAARAFAEVINNLEADITNVSFLTNGRSEGPVSLEIDYACMNFDAALSRVEDLVSKLGEAERRLLTLVAK